jgi:hypothetical protein
VEVRNRFTGQVSEVAVSDSLTTEIVAAISG